MIATRTDSGYDLGMTRGDTETLTVTMTVDEDGTTGIFDAIEAVLTVRTSREGGMIFQLNASSKAGRYVYDIQATTAEGVVKTPLGGLKKPCYLTLWQDVTYGGN